MNLPAARARRPEIVGGATVAILATPPRELGGQCLLDEDFLRTRGVEDFAPYAWDAAAPVGGLLPDLFL